MLLLLFRIAQRRQGVGGLARLRDENGEPAGRHRRLAVAEFRRDIDLDRQARKTLEPVLGDQAGVVGGAAGRYRYALEGAEIERQVGWQPHALGRHVEIARERVADDLGLLVNFLRHEVAIIALVDQERRRQRLHHCALDLAALDVVYLDALAGEHGGVAILQIGDRVGERRERDGIGAEIHLAVAVTDRERRALARADEEIVLAGEQEGERERAAQSRQCRGHGLGRRAAILQFLGDEMRDDLGIGFRAELHALAFQLFAQLAKVFDDAVVHDREAFGGVGMRVAFARLAVGRPAGMTDADCALERIALEPCLEVAQLAFSAPAGQLPAFQRGDAGRVVAAIFQPLERVDQRASDRLTSENANYTAHASGGLLSLLSPTTYRPITMYRP